MSKSELALGIHEIHTFEVDQFNFIRGIACGGLTLLEAGSNRTDGQLSFEQIFSDDRTRNLYCALVEHVRNTSETISFPYRCDSETHSIYLRVMVFLSSAKNVGFLNRLTGYDIRPSGIKLVREFVDENDDYKCCSICNRFSNSDSDNTKWDEFQALVESAEFPASATKIRCKYDVCNDCERAVTQRINETVRKFERRAV